MSAGAVPLRERVRRFYEASGEPLTNRQVLEAIREVTPDTTGNEVAMAIADLRRWRKLVKLERVEAHEPMRHVLADGPGEAPPRRDRPTGRAAARPSAPPAPAIEAERRAPPPATRTRADAEPRESFGAALTHRGELVIRCGDAQITLRADEARELLEFLASIRPAIDSRSAAR